MASSEIPYAFDTKNAENEAFRLKRQSDGLAGPTSDLIAMAGIPAGARVLEVGCGTGLVSLLAADHVGPSGTVVAVDRDPHLLEVARDSVATTGFTNIEFLEADFNTIELEPASFDAVIGRYVLMYQPDPVAAVARLATLLRPNGVAAFLEISNPDPADRPTDFRGDVWPRTDVSRDMYRWFNTVVALGTHPYMGHRLPETFALAGLVPSMQFVPTVPLMRPDPLVGVAQIRALLPKIVELGISTADEVNIDNLGARLAALPPYFVVQTIVIGTWATKP